MELGVLVIDLSIEIANNICIMHFLNEILLSNIRT